MTDSEILARWQGYKQHPNGVSCYTGELRLIGGTLKWPDYPNDDAAAMSLLDTLVEKGYDVRLQSFLEDPPSELWQCSMWRQMPTEQNDSCGYCIIDVYRSTRREAVVAACLELIGKEAESD